MSKDKEKLQFAKKFNLFNIEAVGWKKVMFPDFGYNIYTEEIFSPIAKHDSVDSVEVVCFDEDDGSWVTNADRTTIYNFAKFSDDGKFMYKISNNFELDRDSVWKKVDLMHKAFLLDIAMYFAFSSYNLNIDLVNRYISFYHNEKNIFWFDGNFNSNQNHLGLYAKSLIFTYIYLNHINLLEDPDVFNDYNK